MKEKKKKIKQHKKTDTADTGSTKINGQQMHERILKRRTFHRHTASAAMNSLTTITIIIIIIIITMQSK